MIFITNTFSPSLIVDFSNYYNASVEMTYKGNIYVAWSLLRKPLQETLAYIEWLYVDRYELIELMLQDGNPKKYEIMNSTNRQKRKNHIREIQTEDERHIIDMYNFRYSYKDPSSINGVLQASNHLVTTRPVLKTSESSLNYIFQSDETIKQHRGFYYTSISYIMQYTMKMIFEMFFKMTDFDEYSQKINFLNLYLKNFDAIPIEFKKGKEILQLSNTKICCPYCNTCFSTDEKWIDFINNRFKCNKCSRETQTFGLIFDYMINKTVKIKNESGEQIR